MNAEHPSNHRQEPRRGDNDDSGYHRAVLESPDAVNQDRLSGQLGELFVCAESPSLSGCHNQAVVQQGLEGRRAASRRSAGSDTASFGARQVYDRLLSASG
jgi:hypothetical protein